MPQKPIQVMAFQCRRISGQCARICGQAKGIIAVTATAHRMKVRASGEMVPTTAFPTTQLSDQKSAVTLSSR